MAFHGDMYVGSIQTIGDNPMTNVDFLVGDLDSSSAWLKAAGAENLEYSRSMKQLEDVMREKGGMQTMGGDGGMPGGTEDGYSWSQTDDEVEVAVGVPAGTKAKEVKIVFKPMGMAVKVGGADTLSLDALYRKVRPDECTWTMEGAKIVVSLAKVDESVWHQLVAVEGL